MPRLGTRTRRIARAPLAGAASRADACAAAFFAARAASGAKRRAMADTVGSGVGVTGLRLDVAGISAAIRWAKLCGLGISGI
jgi:hypothetical protein